MALLFVDSFDHYATADLLTKWTTSVVNSGNSLSIAATSGRRGSGGFRWTNGFNSGAALAAVTRQLTTANPTCVMGFAVQVPASLVGTAGMQIAVILDTGTDQVSLRLNADFTLAVCRGTAAGTVLGTTTLALSAGTFAYLEWKVLIDPSAGTVDVRINGVSALALTAQNTRNTANTRWTAVTLGVLDSIANNYLSNNLSVTYDDCYVLDGTGAAPWNTFLGDVRVDARYPTAAGATTAWTPSTGANWSCVDETAPNGDTDYTSSTTVGQTDTFTTQDAPVVGATIYGVQHCLSLKKSDAGACTVAPVIRHSGIDYPGADLAPAMTYGYGLQIAAVNPGTGAAWTEAGFNAAEFGYKRTA